MLPNPLNSLLFFLGLMLIRRVVQAAEEGVITPNTIIRVPVLVPGKRVAAFNETMTGRQCIRHCAETKKCMYIATQPVDWDLFDKINENKAMYFIEKLRNIEVVFCWLFARLGDAKPTQRWTARGAKVLSKAGWRSGDLLLAVKIWIQPNETKFNPENFLPPPENNHFKYVDPDFLADLENQGPPDCTFTPTVSSLAPEKEPTSTSEEASTPNEENSESPDPTEGTQGTSPRTNPLTTTTAKPKRDLSNTIRLYSFICGGATGYGFTIECTEQHVNATEVIFTSKPTEVGCGDLMPIKYSGAKTAIAETTIDTAKAFCARQRCGRLTVPIAKQPVYIPSLDQEFEIYTEVETSIFCYALEVVKYF